jgi:hypothetical protein
MVHFQTSKIKDSGDRYSVMDSVEREAAKPFAIACKRDGVAEMFPNCVFLPPTKMDTGVVVGLIFGERTVLAEHRKFCEAYHRLVQNVVRLIL